MTMTAVKDLFHVFLVEDEEGLNRDLKALIELEIPGTVVTSALNVSEALRRLDEHDLMDVDVAVLDLRLPETQGAVKKIHPVLADRMKEMGVPSILMTGYVGSDDVDGFIKDRKLCDPPLKVISKREMDSFFDTLKTTIHEYFVEKASKAVKQRINSVFGNTVTSAKSRGSSTGELMALQWQTMDYWNYLSEGARNEVRRHFRVEDGPHCCRLTLIPPGQKPTGIE